MEKLTNIIFIVVCVITLYTTWKIHARCRKAIRQAGTRFAQLESKGQFISRWLLTLGSVSGIIWQRTVWSEGFMYLAIASYLLWAYRYYKAGGWLGKILNHLNW